jgi:hypothetical protein
MSEVIWTTQEDIDAERANVRRMHEEENKKWPVLRRYVADVRRWEHNLSSLQGEAATLRAFGWVHLHGPERARWRQIRDFLLPYARGRLIYWRDAREAVIRELRIEIDARVAEEERLSRKQIPPPPPVAPKPIVAVVDSSTGYLITYLDQVYRGVAQLEGFAGLVMQGQVWLYDEEKERFLTTVDRIRIEYTLSVATEGHEDLFCEVTGWTTIDATEIDHKFYIKDITERIIAKVEAWLLEQFTQQNKEGLSIVPSFVTMPDFTIQERERQAKVEGFIKTWMQTLEGWTQQPRILKRGIGYYTAEETDPHFPLVAVFVEYSHDGEEPQYHVHKLPKAEEAQIIDP